MRTGVNKHDLFVLVRPGNVFPLMRSVGNIPVAEILPLHCCLPMMSLMPNTFDAVI